jgi:thermitase
LLGSSVWLELLTFIMLLQLCIMLGECELGRLVKLILLACVFFLIISDFPSLARPGVCKSQSGQTTLDREGQQPETALSKESSMVDCSAEWSRANPWSLTAKSDWERFAKMDGDLAELTIGVDSHFRDNLEGLKAMVESKGGRMAKRIAFGEEVKAVSVRVPFSSMPMLAEQLSRSKLCRYVEPNWIVTADLVPNDSNWNLQWGPKKIEADFAWNTTMGSKSVLVAVIDTGVDYHHPDLAANYVPLGYDWVNNDTDPADDHGHGTHCAGIIAATINNNLGIAGIAQVRIMAEKGLDAQGSGDEADLAQCIIHAVGQGANILSNSWGGGYPSRVIEEAIEYAYSHNVLVLAAAGNTRSSAPHYPGAYDEVVAVTATDSNDNPASFTTFGDWVEVSAPGVNIYSTVPGGYVSMSGTSMACPHAAGVAALILSKYPNMTNVQLRMALRYATDELGAPGFDVFYGYGRVNARKAVEELPVGHDLVLWNWSKPLFVEPQTIGLINATVYNFAMHSETDVMIQLSANETLVDSQVIPYLAGNSFASVTLRWEPESEGTYDLAVYVVPVAGETDVRFNTGSGHIVVAVPVRVAVVDSQGTTDPRAIRYAWNKLNTDWKLFGDQLIYIDYVSLAKRNITYEDIKATKADVLFISCAVFREYTDEEIEAITRYVYEGHGLIATANTFDQTVPNNKKLTPLFGISLREYWDSALPDTLNVLELLHPLFKGFQAPYNLTDLMIYGCVPADISWDDDELWGGSYLARGDRLLSAVVAYRGLVYLSPFLEVAGLFDLSLPRNNLQLLYNAMVWSRFQKPEHEVIASVKSPGFLLPNEMGLINATVSNIGRHHEGNVTVQIVINGTVATSSVVPVLPQDSSYTLVYPWRPSQAGTYNVTALVMPVSGEDNLWNNGASASTEVMVPPDILLVADNDEFEDLASNQRTSLQEFKSVLDACQREYYVWEEKEKGSPPLELLVQMKLVIWSVGEAGGWVKISDIDASKLVAYAKQGGKILVEGNMVADRHSGDSDFERYVTHCVSLRRFAHPLLLGGTEGLRTVQKNHPVAFGLPDEIRWNILPVVVEGVGPAYGGVTVLNYLDDYEPPPPPWGYYPDPPVLSWQAMVASEKDGTGSTLFCPFAFLALPELVRLRMIRNALKWFFTGDHELAVRLDLFKDGFQEANRPILVNVTVANQGLSNESQVEMRLSIDGRIVDSNVISLLPSRSSFSHSFLWTPDEVGDHDVAAQVSLARGEYAGDNAVNETVKVRSLVVGVISDPRWEMETVSPILDSINVGYHLYYYNKYLGHTKNLNLLSNYRAIIFGKPNRKLDMTEYATLKAYLDSGGCLLVTDVALIHSVSSSHWLGFMPITGANVDDLMADIVRVKCTTASYLNSLADRVMHAVNGSHPIVDGLYGTFPVGYNVSGLNPYCENVTADAARNAITVARWVAPRFGLPHPGPVPAPDKIVASDLGLGKVVYWNGQGQLEWTQSTECAALLKNIITWFEYGEFHDLKASVELSELTEPGKPVTVEATVRNLGYHDEHGVSLRLVINNVEASSFSLATLGRRAACAFEYVWTPAGEGVANVTVQASLVPVEMNLTNNVCVLLHEVRWWPHVVLSSPEAIEVGQTFSVELVVQNVTGLHAWGLGLYYRGFALNVTSVIEGAFLRSSGSTVFAVEYCSDSYNASHGCMRLACRLTDASADVDGSGVLATITFRAKAAGLICPLTLSEMTLTNTSSEALPHFTIGTDLVIGLLGDLNNDGAVNIFDLVIVTSVYGSKIDKPNWNPQADIVPDNAVNIFDIVKVTSNYGRTKN